jgi:hypothetical protein
VEIGTGMDMSYVPLYFCYMHSYTQSIYYPSELYAGSIQQISWNYNGATTWTETIAIYMGHTTKTAFSSYTDYVALADLTQVYNGSVTFSASGWHTIDLDTPFAYNGSDNLVIAVDKSNTAYYCGAYCYSTATGGPVRSLYYYQDSVDISPAAPYASMYGTLTELPNIQIHY